MAASDTRATPTRCTCGRWKRTDQTVKTRSLMDVCLRDVCQTDSYVCDERTEAIIQALRERAKELAQEHGSLGMAGVIVKRLRAKADGIRRSWMRPDRPKKRKGRARE